MEDEHAYIEIKEPHISNSGASKMGVEQEVRNVWFKQFLNVYFRQGSHLHWKTWKNETSFSRQGISKFYQKVRQFSQGKVREY